MSHKAVEALKPTNFPLIDDFWLVIGEKSTLEMSVPGIFHSVLPFTTEPLKILSNG